MKDPEILIRCAIASLRYSHNHPRRYRGVVLWGLVADIFCCGSTMACEICERYGFDPHEKLR